VQQLGKQRRDRIATQLVEVHGQDTGPAVIEVLQHDAGHGLVAEFLRDAPAVLTVDDLVAVAELADGQRVHEPVPPEV